MGLLDDLSIRVRSLCLRVQRVARCGAPGGRCHRPIANKADGPGTKRTRTGETRPAGDARFFGRCKRTAIGFGEFESAYSESGHIESGHIESNRAVRTDGPESAPFAARAH